MLANVSVLLDPNEWGDVTTVFVAVILALFLFILIHESYAMVRWRAAFKKGEASRAIQEHLDLYQATFLKLEGVQEGKTMHHAWEMLPMSLLRPRVALIRTLPNTLIGLGILGTFVGLSLGVKGLKVSGGSEVLLAGLEVLLPSMSTAFVTSVFGMATSIVSSLYTRLAADFIGKRHSRFCSALDQDHYLGAEGHRALQKHGWREMFEDVFAVHENGKVVLPGAMLYSIQNSEEQTVVKLDAFSTELADGLKLSAQTMDVFNGMAESLSALENKGAQDQASFIGELKDALTELIAGFKQELTGGANDQIEALNGVMGSTVSALQRLPDVLDSTESGFREMVAQIQGTLIAGAGQAAEDITTRTSEMGQRMGEVVEEIMSRQQITVGQVDQLLERVREVIEDGRTGNEALVYQVSILQSAGQALNEGIQDFKTVSVRLEQASVQLDASSGELKNSTERMVADRETLDDTIREVLESAAGVVESYEQKFGEINTSLEGAFSVFNEGMKNYERTANDTINSTLQTFATSLSTATSHLTGAYQSLAEIVQTLEDVLDNRRRG